MAASLLASQHPQLFTSVVLQSGIYDFASFCKNLRTDIAANVVREVGHLGVVKQQLEQPY